MYCLVFDTHYRHGTGFVLLWLWLLGCLVRCSLYEVFPTHAEFIGQPQACWREKHPLNVFTISKDRCFHVAPCSLLSDIIK